MEKEKAVTNANTLIFIAKIGIFDLAKNMFSEIFITDEVFEEIFDKEDIENLKIEKELNAFLKKVSIENIKNLPIDKGEISAISYCLENNIKTFLSDDKKARITAESLGIKAKGILGIILDNLQKKKITNERAKVLIKKLIENGYYMALDLYDELISLIEEN